ncbi:hypothetical protein G9A89_014952 [Geosiphon pyriformis]|nr:hypothetical protein G9A89_014952 [Geosiphon pyriformis]
MIIPRNIQQIFQKLMLVLKTLSDLSITINGSQIKYIQKETTAPVANHLQNYHPYRRETRSHSENRLPRLLKQALEENLLIAPIDIPPNTTMQQKLLLLLNEQNNEYTSIYRYFQIGKTLYERKLKLKATNLTPEVIQKQIYNEFKTAAGPTNTRYKLRAAFRLYDLFNTCKNVLQNPILQSIKITSIILDHYLNITDSAWTSTELSLEEEIMLPFVLSIKFLGNTVASSVQNLLLGDANTSSVLNSVEFGLVHDHLSGLGAGCISVYTNSSLSGLGSVNIKSGAVVFFDDINMGMEVKVSGLMLSTLAKLQAIALALECVLAVLDACKSELSVSCPDFHNRCWVECHYIANFVCSKRLKITWHKVKGHSGNFGNNCADKLAGYAVFSNLILPPQLNERFILAGSDIVSGNSRHFVYDIFCSIHCLRWEYGSDTYVVTQDLLANIDWQRSVSVWHPDSHMAAGLTSKCTAGIHTYFIKALHYRLSVAVCKCLYDKDYPSVICLFCGCVEISDHVFSCDVDAATRVRLLKNYAMIWENISGLHHSIFSVLQFLSFCVLNISFCIALCKGFVFKEWFHKAVSVFGNSKSAGVKIVNFVHTLCLAFRDEIWSVHAKYCAFIEKHNLIPCDSSLPNSKSGLSFVYSAGVIRLLGIDVVLGVSFGFRRFSLFISDAFDVISVSISA